MTSRRLFDVFICCGFCIVRIEHFFVLYFRCQLHSESSSSPKLTQALKMSSTQSIARSRYAADPRVALRTSNPQQARVLARMQRVHAANPPVAVGALIAAPLTSMQRVTLVHSAPKGSTDTTDGMKTTGQMIDRRARLLQQAINGKVVPPTPLHLQQPPIEMLKLLGVVDRQVAAMHGPDRFDTNARSAVYVNLHRLKFALTKLRSHRVVLVIEAPASTMRRAKPCELSLWDREADTEKFASMKFQLNVGRLNDGALARVNQCISIFEEDYRVRGLSLPKLVSEMGQ